MINRNKTIKSSLKAFGLLFTFCAFALSMQAQDKTAAGLYNDGLAALKAKDYEAGLPLMEEALALAEADENEKVIKLAKKNGAVAAYNVGNAKRKADMLDEAMAMYEKGIELNPDYPGNFYGKALVLDGKDMPVESLTALLVAADKYTAAEKKQRAAKLIKKATNDIGRAYTGKKYDVAVAMGDAFLASKSSSDVHYYVSRSLIEQGNNEKAAEHAEQAIAGITDDMDVDTKDKYYIAKGLALENLGKNADAVAAFKMVAGEKYKKQADFRIQKLGS